MTNLIALTSLTLAIFFGPEGTSRAQSVCATQKDAEACRKRFGVPEGRAADAVVVATIENDLWRFDYRPSAAPAHNTRKPCSARGGLTLARGSHVEAWLIADRGIHVWKVPDLDIDQTAMAGSYAPLRIDTSKAGQFASLPDARNRKPPTIRILEPAAYEAWAAKSMGRHCTAEGLRAGR